MALPKAIERQAQEAAALQQALQPQVVDPNVVTAAAQLTPPANDPPASAPPPPPEPPAPPAPPSVDFEHKYKTLKGMYDAQLPPLQRQLQETQRAQEALQRELAQLKSRKEEPKPKEAPKVDERDEETFGKDMMSMVQRYLVQHGEHLTAMFNSKVLEIEGRVGALEETVNGVNRRTSESLEQQFFALLTKLVPDWQQVNEDEDFKLWLDGVDPIYGARRQDALEHAYQRHDAQRVANVFNAFKALQPKPLPAESLANQVAPTTVAAAPAPAQQPAVQYISERFIKAFYNEFARTGKFEGSAEKAKVIEAQINKAAAEGRIVP